MFDFSLAELGVVGVVALLVLGPDEMLKVLGFFKNTVKYLKQESAKYMDEIKAATGADDLVKIVFDDEGNPQKAYDLEKIKPILKQADDE